MRRSSQQAPFLRAIGSGNKENLEGGSLNPGAPPEATLWKPTPDQSRACGGRRPAAVYVSTYYHFRINPL